MNIQGMLSDMAEFGQLNMIGKMISVLFNKYLMLNKMYKMLNKTQETIYYVESIHTPHFHLCEILDQQALTSDIISDFCCVVLKS